MNLISYLLKFYFYDFHKKYFRLLYRLSVILSHQFGIMAMIKSLFKPLFGFPGVLSKINGFVIRTLVITISLGIVIIGVTFGIALYICLVLGVPFLLYKNFWIGFLILGFLILYRISIYLLFPLGKIKNPLLIKEYFDAGNYKLRSYLNKIKQGQFNDFISNIKNNNDINQFLRIAELPIDGVIKFVDENRANTKADEYIEKLIQVNSSIKNNSHLSIEVLFCAYLLHFSDSEDFLNSFDTNSSEFIGALNFINFLKVKNFSLWSDEYNLPPAGGIDKSWAVGYTSNLNKYGTDLTKLALNGLMPKLVGRDQVKQEFVNILSKSSRNNVMLIGEPGCGKTTFVHAMAREIAMGTKIEALRYKRIISLDITALESGTEGDVKTRITNIIKEVLSAGNIILFVDEIHTLSAGESFGANGTTLFNALEPYLSFGKFQFIGTTTHSNYEKYVAPNASFARDFDIVNIPEATEAETVEIIEEIIKNGKSVKESSKITYRAINTAVVLAKRYLHSSVLPDKAVELILQAISELKGYENQMLDNVFLKKVFSEVADIPVSAINVDEKKVLMNLEEILHKSIIGQDLAVTSIVNALKRSRTGVRDDKKPIASFLFSGPTGVGKTETAKVLAKNYFGTPKDHFGTPKDHFGKTKNSFGKTNLVTRIDMSEFSDAGSVGRLIGDQNGNIGILTSKVKTNPYSLVLLDDVEKANKEVLNLFLQVLDDGRLTDSSGEVIDFTNTFIIMTTNAGTKEVIKTIDENKSEDEIVKITIDELKKYFSAEFLNRFTALIPFTPLTMDQVKKITEIKLNELKMKMLEKNKIRLSYSNEVIDELSKNGFSKEWGARPLNRLIEGKVETLIADKIINNEIKPGDEFYIASVKAP